jgi:exodeoxyribonuclease VII large subunit
MILERDLAINVPFKERFAAKSLGAKPNYDAGVFKCWVVKAGSNVLPFKAWWAGEINGAPIDYVMPDPEQVSRQSSLVPELEDNPFFMDEQPFIVDEPKVIEKGVTLHSVLSIVKRAVSSSFPEPIWIRVEVINITGSNHVYLELSDYDASGQEKSKARGMIWSSNKGIISRWEKETGMKLSSGVRVLVSAIPEFSEKFGLGLKILNIDSQFSVGEMELKLNEIRRRLSSEGIIDFNKRLSRPVDFTNVAVIAPDAAAGLGDFMSQANVLIESGICQFAIYHAYFQGDKVKSTMLSAFHLISMDIAKGIKYDAIVVIRGGGDKAGLNALNEYEIAKLVCVADVPVLVGIGHERDVTILDEVAHTRYATPSLVVSAIIGAISGNAEKAKRDYERVKKMSSELVLGARMTIDNRLNKIKLLSFSKSSNAKDECKSKLKYSENKASQLIAAAKNKCDADNLKVHNAAKALLVDARGKVQMLGRSIMPHHPSHSLIKGYAVVRSDSGKVITGAECALVGDRLTIEFKSSKIEASVSGVQLTK